MKKILVIDDNKIILKSLFFLLRNGGYEVCLAESGAEAIKMLRTQKPDLVLLDLNLPPESIDSVGLFNDGLIVIDWARRMGFDEKIPVIIISSEDPAKYQDRARQSGIVTFFQKPVDKVQLLAAVEVFTAGDSSLADEKGHAC
jgi:two-component system, cell cycle response regulator DivK